MAFLLGYSEVEIDFLLKNSQQSLLVYLCSLHYLCHRNKQSSSMIRLFDFNQYSQPVGYDEIVNQASLGYIKIPSYSMNLSYTKPFSIKNIRVKKFETNINEFNRFPMFNTRVLNNKNGNTNTQNTCKSPLKNNSLSGILNLHNIEDLQVKQSLLSMYISQVKSLRHDPYPVQWVQNASKFKKFSWIQSRYEIEFPTINSLISESSKLKTLDTLLKRLKREKHRVLIFCQMTKMMNIIEDYLQYKKFKYYRLDGGSGINERRDMVDGFQSRDDIFVFLLSTRAGGLGVTLTAADDVIFYDNDWNPTMDAQAEDRAHRIGNACLINE
jgi:SNF2 family DNA or RNA helicase